MKNGKFLWSGIALRAAGILTLALVLMLTACPNPAGDNGKIGADKSALTSAIADADAAKTGITASDGGARVAVGALWVTKAVWDAFDAAISAANEVKNSGSADQAQVDAATATLKAAITAFNNAKRTKGAPSTSALTSKITNAQDTWESAIVAASSGSVAIDENWATEAQVAELNTAIAAARSALTAIDQSVVDAAMSALNTALTAFNSAVAENGPGTKTSGFTPEEFNRLKNRAAAAKARVTAAANGDDVPPSDTWVTQAVLDTFESAITAAAALSDSVYLALSSAVKTFNSAKQPGSTPDTATLLAAINSADVAKEGVEIAANSAEASKGSAWVTQAQWDALTSAYDAAHDAATKNAVAQAIIDLTGAVTAFNNAKMANGLGTKEKTVGLTISGIGALYKNGTSVLVTLFNDKSLDNPVSYKGGTVTSGALSVSLGGANGSYYIGFTSDNSIVFISKTKVDLSGGIVSIVYTDFELYIWSTKFSDLNLISSMTLDAFMLASSMNMDGGPFDYDGYKQMLITNMEEWFGIVYVNLDFQSAGFYKDAACTQEFSGSDTVEPDMVIYTQFPIGGINDDDDVDAVGYITGTISFTGYSGQRPKVKIGAQYWGHSYGAYGGWVSGHEPFYTIDSSDSFSIPFTQEFLTALQSGTQDLSFALYTGATRTYDLTIDPSIPVTVSQLSDGNLNVGNLGSVNLTFITLNGTITVTLNGQSVPYIRIYAYGGNHSGDAHLASPGSNAAWSIPLLVFDSPTTLRFWVTGEDWEGNQLFEREEAASVSGVYNTDRTVGAINLGNITTTD
jgi:hypothetical protein